MSEAWLKGQDWLDLSIPYTHPAHCKGRAELEDAIIARIKQAHMLLVFAGVYSSHSIWIEFEVTVARALGKPIIAIKPVGQQKLSSTAVKHAHQIVAWRSESIRQAIRDTLLLQGEYQLLSALDFSERTSANVATMLQSFARNTPAGKHLSSVVSGTPSQTAFWPEIPPLGGLTALGALGALRARR
jgi:hypothetical protein